jgi:hypothetical protein
MGSVDWSLVGAVASIVWLVLLCVLILGVARDEARSERFRWRTFVHAGSALSAVGGIVLMVLGFEEGLILLGGAIVLGYVLAYTSR